MFWFIFGVIVAVIGVAVFIKRQAIAEAVELDTIIAPVIIGFVCAVGGVTIAASTTVVTVPTRNIAVVSSYGRTVGTVDNGIHVIAPWQEITNYDASVQTNEWDFPVRMANNITSIVKTVVHWRVEGDIQQIHMDWREFNRIKDNVIEKRTQNVLNKVFETHDPLAVLKEGGKSVPVSSMEPDVKSGLQALVPNGIKIELIQLPFVDYPDSVDKALASWQEEFARTQVAVQQQKTNAAIKLALEELNKITLSPEAFSMQCLIMTERLYQSGKVPNAMWTCVAPNAGAALALQ